MNILVIAAHPDDEVLGMGATIKKLSKKNNVILCAVSEGVTAQYTEKSMIKKRRDACKKSSKILGISDIIFLDFPDQGLFAVHHEINLQLEKIIKKYKPRIVYTTPNDLNRDHQNVYESSLVVTRPHSSHVKQLLCYELPGHVNQQFHPNVYENIEKEFPYKIKAFKMYKEEVMKFPHPRSLIAIENLAIYRGIQVGLKKVESFKLIHGFD
jgi:LmbE family N-acetylglucosaminyl deacetylase